MTCHEGGGKAVNVMTMLPTAYIDDKYRIVLQKFHIKMPLTSVAIAKFTLYTQNVQLFILSITQPKTGQIFVLKIQMKLDT